MRSIRCSPTVGRPAPSPFGYTGSTSAHSVAHGTTWSICARNSSRRVRLRWISNPAVARLCCVGFIDGSRAITFVGFYASRRINQSFLNTIYKQASLTRIARFSLLTKVSELAATRAKWLCEQSVFIRRKPTSVDLSIKRRRAGHLSSPSLDTQLLLCAAGQPDRLLVTANSSPLCTCSSEIKATPSKSIGRTEF